MTSTGLAPGTFCWRRQNLVRAFLKLTSLSSVFLVTYSSEMAICPDVKCLLMFSVLQDGHGKRSVPHFSTFSRS